ncbi:MULTISPECIES: LysR family transcriptional regulator [Variovorax]|uniref:DNA-binding transcriptional LysR family regulator n=1 Tax=Variovorax paradoxus TaxID=34073 RepID=A0AAE4BXZ9_VARPD|nr:LysR family transcriptional regulator [Variovorax paradoxus]MDR6426377.1 DNA-binding transcriptional LysR family regulator [Variovorax paradoxus]MDR6451370.1 DNA-binding transcriptional LysR family regulator [Variovorax paradoxus]WPH12864.1 LysR family transcriptional regulator [Variovorax paradoxus]
MDRLLAMEMFVRVVETGSFSKAALEFHTTQPTVTKQVAATEARLKVRLLNRNTRGVSLTEPGALYYEKCKNIVREAEEAESIVQLRQNQAQGLLRIGTSVAFGRRVVVPLALEYMRRHPQVQLDLSFEDRYVDLIAQGIDVAIRMGKLADSSLGARYLGTNPWAMVAAPGYLKKHGTPRRAQDLSAHVALIYSSVVGDEFWRMHTPKGDPVTVPVSGRFRSNNLSAVLAAARDGLGIALMPRYVASESLASGKVLEVLGDHKLPEQEIHAVFPSPKLVPGKVSGFVAFLQGRFAEGWWGG